MMRHFARCYVGYSDVNALKTVLISMGESIC